MPSVFALGLHEAPSTGWVTGRRSRAAGPRGTFDGPRRSFEARSLGRAPSCAAAAVTGGSPPPMMFHLRRSCHMRTRRIGDVQVSAIGLGGMPMSIEGRPDESRSVATIHAALDAGVTFIDTADAYHIGADEVGHNESLIAGALATYGGDTSDVLIATKGGHVRPGDGSWALDGSPAPPQQAGGASPQRLGGRGVGAFPDPPPGPGRPAAPPPRAPP